MAPLLVSGETVLVARRGPYWPGDLVIVHASDGRLLAHRLLGAYPKNSRLFMLTQADAASRPDAAVPLTCLVGKVTGGQAHPHPNAIRVPFAHRLRACGLYLGHALRAMRRRW